MDDLISRQAAIDAINHICPVDTEYDCILLDRVDVRCVLLDLPSAQPENTSNNDCNGCKFVGCYDTDFPCANCIRKNKDYYASERRTNE